MTGLTETLKSNEKNAGQRLDQFVANGIEGISRNRASNLISSGYVLLDVQFHTPHLAQFGCLELPRAVYLEQLKHAIDLECDPLGDPSR